jgi:glycosyltransferase involved in cell wall biosynthesis
MSASSRGPIVSVVIPCYGQAAYLRESVESVVAQTYESWEAVIVDDGSPDDTAAVARELIAAYGSRIRLIEQANAGLSAARNAGIEVAAGRYILPLDADDRIAPTMLERTVAVLEEDPSVSVVYVQAIRFGAVTGEWTSGKVEYDADMLTAWNYVCPSSLFRSEAWATTGGYQTDMVWGYEDWDFWLACAAAGLLMKRVPEALFYYRVRPNTRTATADAHRAELMRLIVSHHPRFLTRRRRAVGHMKYFLHRVRRKAGRILASPHPRRQAT